MTGDELLRTRGARLTLTVVGLLGVVSLLCLALYYGALLDIWHEAGRPDFWAGEGVAALEWRWLAVLFWPMLLFHLGFLGAGLWLVRSRGEKRRSRTDQRAGVRRDHEPPRALAEWGWRYHHVGIPTDVPRPGEVYLEAFGMHVAGFATSPYGVEWMRFEPGSPVSELIRTVPHLAFVVDDLDAALVGREVLTPPNSPSSGLRVAMIVHDGAPVELMEFAAESDDGLPRR